MKIEYDKDFEKVTNELQDNFGWSNIDILPDSYKEMLNDTIKAVKNCSIPAGVGRSELLPCDYCEEHRPLKYCQECWEKLEQFKQCY